MTRSTAAPELAHIAERHRPAGAPHARSREALEGPPARRRGPRGANLHRTECAGNSSASFQFGDFEGSKNLEPRKVWWSGKGATLVPECRVLKSDNVSMARLCAWARGSGFEKSGGPLMPLRNWIVLAIAGLVAGGAAWAFIAANTVQDARKSAGGNHGYQGNTVPSYVKIHDNDAAGRPLVRP
jgi:hypothetical protein